MKMAWLMTLGIGLVTGTAAPLLLRGQGASDAPERGPARQPSSVAANGVVEGARPEVALRPEVAGTIAAVLVQENQEVSRGRLLVQLHDATQQQQVALAEAERAVAQAQLDRLRNGERPEKRAAATAAAAARRAVYQQARADWERSRRLIGSQSVSAQQSDADYYRMVRSQGEMDEAAAEQALAEAPARADELAMAQARVAAAGARLRLAQAELEKTRLRAPSNGRILRVHAEPGEMAGPASAQPVLLLADLSRCRVRAFVEELDAPRAQVGQSARVSADGLPGKEFRGRVAVVLPRMGKRSQPSDAAAEYKDLYYREVLIDLDGWDELTLNLRVQVHIDVQQVGE